MYNTALVFKKTREDVYKKINSYDIYKRYLQFAPIVGRVYNSPLRKDTNPSFGLFYTREGTLLFKDLGSGESGDAIKFVKLMENISTQQAIDFILSDFMKYEYKPTKHIPRIEPDEKNIYVHRIDWTKEGLKYWSQYGITKETLNHFKVSQIDKYWVNGFVKGYATESNPMFHFEIYDKDKIYRPYYKAKRFYTNCTRDYIQGWKQLDYSKDTVIITKSLKDVMYLYQLGYTAIAPNGEGHSISEKALEVLKRNFKHIIIFYDWDNAGVIGTKKLLKKNPEFGFIFTNDKKAKDISDYHKLYGRNQAKELLQTKLNYCYERHFKHRPNTKSNKDA